MKEYKDTIPKLTRPWDPGIPEKHRELVRARRKCPTGIKWDVRIKHRGGVTVWEYPWSSMKDGDFFVVPISKYDSQVTTFRQTASRNNFEVAIHVVTVDGKKMFRVCKVITGVRAFKLSAKRLGRNVPIHDPDRRRRYAKDYRKGRASAPVSAVTVVPSKYEPPVAEQTIVTEANYDRAAALKEARRRAAFEEAGLDPDLDEDVMGIFKE